MTLSLSSTTHTSLTKPTIEDITKENAMAATNTARERVTVIVKNLD